jgi:protein-L-isoaspartate(D-aspartate) O-methyltransferase
MVRSLLITLAVIGLLSIDFVAAWAEDTEFSQQRKQMVDQQLRARGIKDTRVLDAMQTVRRHLFVPEALRGMAYADTPLSIGHEQTISQPYIVALMSEVIAVQAGQRVLEIGTGSGYQAAILAEMGAVVFTIEIVPQLADRARQTLQTHGYETVRVKIGDGYLGWPEAAPFDAIIVTCAPEKIPRPLQTQLVEGGRMVIPVGERHHQRLMLLTKKEGNIHKQKIVDVRFVPMVDSRGNRY